MGNRRLYPMEEMMPERRTHDDTATNSKYAVDTGLSRQGVKGASCMLQMNHFDIVDGFVVEYMHAALLGVVKQFLSLWTDPANHEKCFFIDRYALDKLTERLLAIKPPRDVGFLPRSLDLRHQWKPAEFKYFLLLYSPVILQGALPSTHYLHWLLFVNGIHLLMGTSISVEDLEKADLCLLKFVRLVPQLYGIESASYNTHLLTHMATSVENWGPLWATSAFMFKDASKLLLEPFSGTRPTPKLIMKQFLAQRQLRQVADEVMANSPDDSQTLFRQLMGVIPPVKDIVQLSNVCKGIGLASRRTLTVQERMAVEQLLDADLIDHEGAYFDRFMVGEKLFTTSSYAAGMKRDDSIVIMQGRRQVIGRILKCVALTPSCTCTALCTCPLVCAVIMRKLRVRKNSQAYDDFVEMDLRSFLLNVVGEGYMFACYPENILEKCIIVEQTNSSVYVLRLPVCE